MYKNNKSVKALLIFYAVIMVALFIYAPSFYTASNITDILLNTTTAAIGAMGMLLILLIGEIDVSAGATLAACCTLTGILAKSGYPLIVVILATMFLGFILGFINGSVVTFLKLESIVATLGLLSIYRGVLIIVTKGSWITGLPENILNIGQGRFLNIPIPIYITLAVVIIMAVLLNKTGWGRNFFAVGSNVKAAYLSGINVNRTRIYAFAVCGLLIGLAAVIHATRFGGIQTNTGKGWEMVLISSAVVGGASTVGGEGTVVGAVLGALLVSTISTILIFFNIDALWEQAVQGVIILVSVASYAIKMPKKVKLEKRAG